MMVAMKAIVDAFVLTLSVEETVRHTKYSRQEVLDALIEASDTGELQDKAEWLAEEEQKEDNHSQPRLIYIDGATPNNQGKVLIGGLGGVVYDSEENVIKELSEAVRPTESYKVTNQRCELMAFIWALGLAVEGDVIRSDSRYVVDGWNQNLPKWVAKGWRLASNKLVMNTDLWRQVWAKYDELKGRIEVQWVKGHSGDKGNDYADALATKATQAQ